MNDQHARVPGGGVPQCGVREPRPCVNSNPVSPRLQNPALARRAHLDTVFDHAGDACPRASRATLKTVPSARNFAIGGGDDE